MNRRRLGTGWAFLRHIWLIAGVTAGTVGLAAWWASREAPRYRSAVTVEIEGDGSISALADRTGLEIVPAPSGRAVEIRFTASDAEAARRGAWTAAEVVWEASVTGTRQEAGVAQATLESELRDVESRAAAAGSELERLRALDRRARLESERRAYQELLGGIAQARGAGPAAGLRGAAARGVPDPAIESLRSRWAGFRSQRAALLSGPAALAANHPDVQRLSTLVASSEATLEGAVRNRVALLDLRIDEAGAPAGVAPTDRTPADTVRLLETLGELGRRAAGLQLEIARVGAAASAGATAPIEGGATERLPRNPWPELLIGLLAGLLIGGGAAVVRARASATGAPAATSEPRIPRARPVGVGRPRVAAAPTAPAKSAPDAVPMLAVIPLVTPTLVEPLENGDFRPGPGQVAGLAAYRELRDRLVRSRWGLKTLVVTSAHPGEGKTTTSTNLAATYARQGLKVVLIECDLRRPSLGRYFRITKQIDLMDVLFENRDWRLALQLTRTPGLYVLLGEKSFPRAGDSLGGPEMKRLLYEITREYDLVILDSSPLLVAADATVLGPIVDGVLLVVRATRTDRRTVEDVIERLREVGATVVGSVLNDPDGAAAEWLSSAGPDPPGERMGSETPVPPSPPS